MPIEVSLYRRGQIYRWITPRVFIFLSPWSYIFSHSLYIQQKLSYQYEKNMNNSKNESSDVNEINVNFVTVYFAMCKNCGVKIFSNNKLHQHVRSGICSEIFKITFFHFIFLKSSKLNFQIINKWHFTRNRRLTLLIKSDVFKKIEPGFEFRKWYYMKIKIQFFKNNSADHVCLNSKCTMFLINKNYLRIQNFNGNYSYISEIN